MSIAQNKANVRRIHEQINRGHIEIIEELYAPDYVGHIGARLSDRDGFKANLTVIEPPFRTGKAHLIGTHSGAWKHPVMGRPDATNRFAKSTRIIIRRIKYGKVEESWLNAITWASATGRPATQAGAKT